MGMKFPLLKDIATTSVVYVDITISISKAIDKMIENSHRSVLVKDGNIFRILRVLDILHIQKEGVSLSLPLSKLSLPLVPMVSKNKNVLDTLEYLSHPIECLCIVDDSNALYGIITHTDITSNIDPDTLMDNYRVEDFLKIGSRVKKADKEEITSKVLSEMFEMKFDHVVIVQKNRPIGILTTRDVMMLIKSNQDLSNPLKSFMSTPVESINKKASIKEAITFIKSKHFKRAVVVDEHDEFFGVISQNELISLTYSKWAELMKEYQTELSEINHMLESKSREFEALASTDPLTGLYNRYKFTELYLSTYTTMVQRRSTMSIMLLDIDFFKNVNDTYGHNVGDQVLIQVSHALLKILRNIDIICRWGGEEFLVLLPSASLQNTIQLANKVREYIENLNIDHIKSLTVSLGVSEVHIGDDMQEAVERVDKALYLAKESGRNCVRTELDLKEA